MAWTLAGFLAASLAACDGDNEITGPGDDGQEQQLSTINGSVESTHETASSSVSSFQTHASATAGASAQPDASTVAAVAVQADGSLDVLAEAEVQADGRFSIQEVPVGVTDLIVVARSSGGAEVGRVLVHGQTRANTALTAAPINGETTVEGFVFERLKAAGVADEIANTAQLALLLRMEESTAAEVAASAQAIQEVADGYRAQAEATSQTFAALGAGVDGQAKAQAMLEAAQQHARDRDGGASADAAADAFLEAGLEALIQAGADAEEASLATTAAATGLDRAMAEANENARLDIARNAVELNLLAREELLAGLEDSESKQDGAQALARARADAEASASLSALAQALMDAEASFDETLVNLIMSKLSNAPESVRTQVQARLETAFAEADFSAQAETAVSVDEIVQAVTDYREQVRAAVESLVAALPSDGDVSAQVSAELLVAVKGGPDIDPPEGS